MHCAQLLNPHHFPLGSTIFTSSWCLLQGTQPVVPFLCVPQPARIPGIQQGVRIKAQVGRAGTGQNKEWQMAEGSKTAPVRSDEGLAAFCTHKNSAAGQDSESEEKLELRGDRGSSQSPAGPAAPRTARHGWAHQTAHGWRPTSH